MSHQTEFSGKIIVHIGDTWKILTTGARTENNIYCHLASTHKGKQQKNGWVPQQICDWVDAAVVKAAK